MIALPEILLIFILFVVPALIVGFLIRAGRKKNRPPPLPESKRIERKAEPGATDNPDDAQ